MLCGDMYSSMVIAISYVTQCIRSCCAAVHTMSVAERKKCICDWMKFSYLGAYLHSLRLCHSGWYFGVIIFEYAIARSVCHVLHPCTAIDTLLLHKTTHTRAAQVHLYSTRVISAYNVQVIPPHADSSSLRKKTNVNLQFHDGDSVAMNQLTHPAAHITN